MRRETRKRFEQVEAATGKEFREQMQLLLSNIDSRNVKITYNMRLGHCAYLEWDEDVTIPEDTRDEYELRGEYHYCRDCPCLIAPMDKRKVRAECAKGITRLDSKACLFRYEQIEKERAISNMMDYEKPEVVQKDK